MILQTNQQPQQHEMTTITISRKNRQALLELGERGESCDSVLSNILADRKAIARILLEQQKKKFESFEGTTRHDILEDDSSTQGDEPNER